MAIVYKRRSSPEKRERLRRARLAQSGRLHDGLLTDTSDNILYYRYEIRGVVYNAAQDVSQVLTKLPDEPERLIGPVTLRYAPQNPANSILVAEEWCGIRPIRRPLLTNNSPSESTTSAAMPPREA